MKKIQLTDGQPCFIDRKNVKRETITLLEKVMNECLKSGLSYIEVNKALYLADSELYKKIINNSIQ